MGNNLQDWAHDTLEEYFQRKPTWNKAEWTCLSRAIRMLEEPQFRTGWLAFLRNDEAHFSGKSPRLFLQNADRFIQDGERLRASVRVEDEGINSRMARQVRRARQIMKEMEVPFNEARTIAAKEMGLLRE